MELSRRRFLKLSTGVVGASLTGILPRLKGKEQSAAISEELVADSKVGFVENLRWDTAVNMALWGDAKWLVMFDDSKPPPEELDGDPEDWDLETGDSNLIAYWELDGLSGGDYILTLDGEENIIIS